MLQFVIALLVLLCVQSANVKLGGNNVLVWKSNDAGLYSHFFQTKYMSGIATQYGRTLSIAPYSDSTHSKDKGAIVMCDIFNFSASFVTCLSNANSTRGAVCHKYFDFLESAIYSRLQNVCFDGRVFGKSGIVPNATKIATLNVGPRLVFTNKYITWFKYIESRYLASLPSGSNQQYMVVHWRRGDQLTTRCSRAWKAARDFSVNCGNVSALIASINAFLERAPSIVLGKLASDTMRSAYSAIDYRKLPVLIATNEKNETILNELRKHQYMPLAEMLHKHDTLHQLNVSLDEFIVESQFMLEAAVLLTFGVSGINDVMESERMQRGLPYCLISDPPGVHHTNWCTLYAAASPAERRLPLPSPIKQRDDVIAGSSRRRNATGSSVVAEASWKTKDLSTYSSDTIQWQEKNSVYTKDLLHVLWTDDDIIELLQTHYPNLLEFYKKLNMNIKRADLSRYLILHRYGGVYMDLDIELRKNITELFLPTMRGGMAVDAQPLFVSYISREYATRSAAVSFAGNAFFASAPNSTILWDMVEHIMKHPNQKGHQPVEVLAHTGPIGLGTVVKKHRMKLNDSSSFDQSQIRILSYNVVGNLADNPSHAAHRRKHSWKP